MGLERLVIAALLRDLGESFTAPVKVMTEEWTIELGRFLKLTGVVQSGGEAKHLIKDGEVAVNGQTETRRGRKLRVGDRVSVSGGADLTVSR